MTPVPEDASAGRWESPDSSHSTFPEPMQVQYGPGGAEAEAARTRREVSAILGQDAPVGPVLCDWFAMCTREATHVELHPVIAGGVPACDSCPRIGR